MVSVHLPSVDNMPVPQRARVIADGRLDAAEVEVDLDAAFTGQVEVPVRQGDENEATGDVSKSGWDEGLPDVEARTDFGRPAEDGDRDEIHVGDDVVEGEGDEGGGREPDRDDLRHGFAGRDGEPDGHADEPICCRTGFLSASGCSTEWWNVN